MPSGAVCVESCSIRVSGLVQGVGFRPTVWRLAHDEGLTGFVQNDGSGVAIEVTGPRAAIERFCQRIRTEAPPLAQIDRIETQTTRAMTILDAFVIRSSVDGRIATGIVPDAATCSACIMECFDPSDPRHGYAFTNCTHCGPRLSIVESIPYDRQTTTMSTFAMCPSCQGEYCDPADRRFHAQPNACPRCGPQLWLEDGAGRRRDHSDPLAAAAQLLREGRIVAVKGLGGFHLACDATQGDVVAELRRRKSRDHKPLALMVRDLATARSLADLSSDEEAMLSSISAPIVLVARRDDALLAAAIAQGQVRIGIMLPYTPLHHLLLADVDRPLVMTSGNLSNEPQCILNEDARSRIGAIADAFLMHDREIANRLDDSVVRIDDHGPTIMRRARGFAPAPVQLAQGFASAPDVLAFGGELKSTFCFMRDGSAVLSQHLGDLEEPATCEDYRKTLAFYRRLYEFEPRLIAIDKHNDYATSTWGATLAEEAQVPLVRVQHHHAHLAAVLAENQIETDVHNVLGIILDGTGLGDDGTIWGGEFLLGGYQSFERVGYFEAVGLPGGAAAVREPWRNTYAHLRAAGLAHAGRLACDTEALKWLCEKPLVIIDQMLARELNAPLASSAGRLFDAVAGILGVCRDRQTYEGEAAMLLEALATPHMANGEPYPFQIGDGAAAIVSFAPMWLALMHDLGRGADPGLIAARFHRTLIDALARCVADLQRCHSVSAVALSGGVFQNRLLLDGVGAAIERLGLCVLRHRQVPANDGGLSLGQAAIAAATNRLDF